MNMFKHYKDMPGVLHTSKHIPEKFGAFIAGALILYFFIMKLMGLAQITELRLINLPIYLIGMHLTFQQYRKANHGRLDYFHGMLVGAATTFVCVTIFAVFVFAYLQLNQHFMEIVKTHAPMGEYLTAYSAAFSLWLEGIFAGYLSCFILVNWKHTDKVELS